MSLSRKKRSPQAERTQYEVTCLHGSGSGVFYQLSSTASNVLIELQPLGHLQVIVVSRSLVASEETDKNFRQTLKTYVEEARAQPGNLQ